MIVEIILTFVCVIYPGRKENIMKTCNTQVFWRAGLSSTLQCDSLMVCGYVHIHTVYTHTTDTYIARFGGGEQRFGDNWGFLQK